MIRQGLKLLPSWSPCLRVNMFRTITSGEHFHIATQPQTQTSNTTNSRNKQIHGENPHMNVSGSAYAKRKRLSSYSAWLSRYPMILVLEKAPGIETDLNWQKLKQKLEDHNDEYNQSLGTDLNTTDPNLRYILYDHYVFPHAAEMKNAISKGESSPSHTFDWMGTERHAVKYAVALTSEALRSEFDVLEFWDGQSANFRIDGVLLSPLRDPEFFNQALKSHRKEPHELENMIDNFKTLTEISSSTISTVFSKLASEGFVKVKRGPNDYVFLLKDASK
ncbi:unnamed protein product [Kuraishia capsulata CBS 1993]|uniref:Uncharacterized protein n=1 Tax=Kuraishia capsulata CBS 1993 TaxID=1382522 RepID=W6MI22_9ASCO|nr:uncharacterized protein KUCA_T00001721001 [Kuraishia capsulata CBS 1993]CDK25751.1 unnamed protein product [Kuraishia capsulata CBS 1993]